LAELQDAILMEIKDFVMACHDYLGDINLGQEGQDHAREFLSARIDNNFGCRSYSNFVGKRAGPVG